MSDIYTGPVCFMDGWHHAVVADADGNDVPGDRLVTDGDGVYRVATGDDTESHNERHSRGFVSVVMEDGSAGERVSPEEFDAIQQLLRDRRGS